MAPGALSGANDALDLNNGQVSGQSPFSGNQAFTIELWYNGTGASIHDRLIGWELFACELSIGQGELRFYDGAWRDPNISGLDDGDWHHVALTNDLDSTRLYVDGTNVYSKASSTFNFQGSYYVCSNYGGVETTQASVDELRFWDHARSATEIANHYDHQVPGNEAGLLSYYRFSQLNLLTDQVNPAIQLTSIGSVSHITTGFGSYIKDFGMHFDGDDDSLMALSELPGASDLTLEAYFKTTSTSTHHERLFGHLSFELELGIVNGNVRAYSGSWHNSSTSNVNDGEWHHCALTHTSGVVKVYLDGVEVLSYTDGNVGLSPGSIMYVGSSYFSGTIDEVRVWSTARTASELISTMNTDLIGNEPNLEMYYDFNTPTSSLWIESLSDSDSLERYGENGQNEYPQFEEIVDKTIQPALGIVEQAVESQFAVFPNPTSESIQIDGGNLSEIQSIYIVDQFGRYVKELPLNKEVWNIASLKTGKYFIHIERINGRIIQCPFVRN